MEGIETMQREKRLQKCTKIFSDSINKYLTTCCVLGTRNSPLSEREKKVQPSWCLENYCIIKEEKILWIKRYLESKKELMGIKNMVTMKQSKEGLNNKV